MSKVVAKTIELKEPVVFGSETFSKLEMSKPKAKHLRKLPQDPGTGDLMDLASRLCDVPPSVIDELSVPDLMTVLEAIGDFLPASQKTGNQS